jgi:hypothetical protein
VSHANVALIPRQRRRIAQLMLIQLAGRACGRVLPRRQADGKRWADRDAAMGVEGMKDRSSRPLRLPHCTPQHLRKVVALRWRQRFGLVGSARSWDAALYGARGANPMPDQPAPPDRHSHRRSPPPLRTLRPGALIHVDVKSM